MKSILFKNFTEFKKLPLWIILIFTVGVFPMIFGKSYIFIYELITKDTCTTHGGECFAGVIMWFVILTFPFAVIVFLILSIISTKDFITLIRKK